ncbi:MAG: neutral/alkaline non-lysosomal ceramidase N-terminal domain-containing protein [Phycisphaerales bacterium]|nr:neutral/alkaline non-lysosomal ceramidase N-terminal domain-containing protein [Phycisphaerales bacterium]
MHYGLATVDLTPPQPVLLAGYAARTAPSEGSYAPLLGRVLLLADESTRFVWVTADLIGFDAALSQRLRARLATLCATSPAAVWLSVSHTHCGPSIRQVDGLRTTDPADQARIEYAAEWVYQRLVAAAAAAAADLRPGSLAVGQGHSDIAISRRRLVDGVAAMLPNPLGRHDPTVDVLLVRDESARPVAAVVGYACHPTTMGGQLLGPDYIGGLRDEVAAACQGLPVLFVNGCGGDLKTRSLNAAGTWSGGPLSEVQRLGRELGRAVVGVLHRPLRPVGGPLRVARRELALPLQPARELAWYRGFLADPDPWRRWWAEQVLAQAAAGTLATAIPAVVQRLAVGRELVVLAMSGEVCSPIGLRVRRELQTPDRPLFVAAYTDLAPGYLAARDQFGESGYEVDRWFWYHGLPAPLDPSAEDRLVAACRGLAEGA